MVWNENIGFVDKIDVKLYRDGKLVDRRITAKKTPLWNIIVKTLRFFGVKKYADDLITNAGKEVAVRLFSGQYPSVSGESIGTGDGTTTTFNATLANVPVIPGTVSITDGTETFSDNGDGTLTGDAGGSGTVNYNTGAVSVTFNTAPANGAGITANYEYNIKYTYVAIGTDDGTTLALDATNTALGAEHSRVAATMSLVTTNVTNDTMKLEATFNFTASATIQESGVFNKSTGGSMLCRQTFPALNVQNGDTLVVTWQITAQ